MGALRIDDRRGEPPLRSRALSVVRKNSITRIACLNCVAR